MQTIFHPKSWNFKQVLKSLCLRNLCSSNTLLNFWINFISLPFFCKYFMICANLSILKNFLKIKLALLRKFFYQKKVQNSSLISKRKIIIWNLELRAQLKCTHCIGFVFNILFKSFLKNVVIFLNFFTSKIWAFINSDWYTLVQSYRFTKFIATNILYRSKYEKIKGMVHWLLCSYFIFKYLGVHKTNQVKVKEALLAQNIFRELFSKPRN